MKQQKTKNMEENKTEARGKSTLTPLLGGENLYVLAETYIQAIQFAQEHSINRYQLKYLISADSVHGLRGGYYAKVGAWYKKNNYYDMEDILKAADFEDVTDLI